MVLPAHAFAPASAACSRTSYHMIFSEGEFEEVAGQEEGSVKRVRQVMLHNRIAIRLPLHFISFHLISTRRVSHSPFSSQCRGSASSLMSAATCTPQLLPSIPRARNCECRYEGEWLNDDMHGSGIMKFADGSKCVLNVAICPCIIASFFCSLARCCAAAKAFPPTRR
jgi:hypothetical protein